MKNILTWVLTRGCEVSTWIALIGYTGLQLSDSLTSAVGQAIAAIMAAVLVAVNEKSK